MHELEILQTSIDLKAECADVGVSLYAATKEFVFVSSDNP